MERLTWNKDERDKFISVCGSFDGVPMSNAIYQKLAECEDLEEKLGEAVYWVGNYRGKFRIVEYTVMDITIFKGGYFFTCGRTIRFFKNEIGKTVFLTRQEAEQALKEREL